MSALKRGILINLENVSQERMSEIDMNHCRITDLNMAPDPEIALFCLLGHKV